LRDNNFKEFLIIGSTCVKHNFRSRTMHLDIIKVFFFLPTDAQDNCCKRIL